MSRSGSAKYGIINCTDISNFDNGKVLKHENTIAMKEQKMLNIMLHNSAMVKPILLAYDQVNEIDNFIKKHVKSSKPFLDFYFEITQETHEIYKITEPKKVKQLISLFNKHVERSYIADGHHRAKTCQLLNNTNQQNNAKDTALRDVLTMYMSWDQLSIYDYNRSIDAFANYSPIEFMGRLSKYCSIKPLRVAKKPKAKYEMTMLLYGEWYRLKWRKKIIAMHQDEVVLFDTFLLNKYILGEVLGILNVREDTRIRYVDGVSGIEGMEQMIHGNENRVGFCMFPIAANDIKVISEAHLTLPPKSTWFEPRVKNGVITKSF